MLPTDLQSELARCPQAGRPGRIFVRPIDQTPYVAVGRDSFGRAAIMLDPLPGAMAFRTQSVEFLPAARLDFDLASTGVADCSLMLYDETGLGGVLRELLPVLMWGLYDSRVKGGISSALAFAQVLALLLRTEGSVADPQVVQGLWAELALITRGSDPETLIRAWHEDPDDVYDFALGHERLEVKSARGAHRRHHFSSSQLPPRSGVDMCVVSMLVQRVAGGKTLFDLLQDLSSRVSASAVDAVLRKVLAVVPISCLNERAYDLASASASVAFYGGGDVPSLVLARDVLSASWTADLAHSRRLGRTANVLAAAATQVAP